MIELDGHSSGYLVAQNVNASGWFSFATFHLADEASETGEYIWVELKI